MLYNYADEAVRQQSSAHTIILTKYYNIYPVRAQEG